jgi:hypothetical protein
MAVRDGRTFVVRGPADPAAALARIATATALAGPDEPSEREGIRYVPTPAARDLVGSEQGGGWPQASASRHRKALRRTPGALFTLPAVHIARGSRCPRFTLPAVHVARAGAVRAGAHGTRPHAPQSVARRWLTVTKW